MIFQCQIWISIKYTENVSKSLIKLEKKKVIWRASLFKPKVPILSNQLVQTIEFLFIALFSDWCGFLDPKQILYSVYLIYM